MITVYVQSTCHRRRFWTSVLPSAPLLRFLAPLKLRPYGAIQMCILLLLFTTSLPAGVPRIAITLSLCLSVCLCIHVYMPVHMSVRWHVSKITRTNIAKFRVHVIYGRGSDHTTARYVLPVLWMTSRSHITTGQNQQTMLFGWVHQLAAPVTDAPRAWGGRSLLLSIALFIGFLFAIFNKKLCYRRGTARRAMLVNSCYFHEVWKLQRFQTAKVTFNFKVIQGHWQWCHSIGHIRFSVSVSLQLCLSDGQTDTRW